MHYYLLLSQTYDLYVICFRVLGVLPGDLCEKCLVKKDIGKDTGNDTGKVDQEKGGDVKGKSSSQK